VLQDLINRSANLDKLALISPNNKSKVLPAMHLMIAISLISYCLFLSVISISNTENNNHSALAPICNILKNKTCNVITSNHPPTADAGPDQTVNGGNIVNLDGSASSDQDGTISSYSWMQIAGPRVDINGGDTPTPAFIAPDVSSNTTLKFSLTVKDDSGVESNNPATVSVKVDTPIVEPVPKPPLAMQTTNGTFFIKLVWDPPTIQAGKSTDFGIIFQDRSTSIVDQVRYSFKVTDGIGNVSTDLHDQEAPNGTGKQTVKFDEKGRAAVLISIDAVAGEPIGEFAENAVFYIIVV
jgi:hypothetical protein